MDDQELRREIERTIRRSQVDAVIREIQNGNRPRVGQVLEHTLSSNQHGMVTPSSWHHSPRLDTYDFEVESWHLEEADRLANRGVSGFRPRDGHRRF